MEHKLKPNKIFPFWRQTWTQMKQNLRVMKTSTQCNRSSIIWNLTRSYIRTEETISNYAMTNCHNEIIEMTLFDVIKSSKYSTETYENDKDKTKWRCTSPTYSHENCEIVISTAYRFFITRSKWAFEKPWRLVKQIRN